MDINEFEEEIREFTEKYGLLGTKGQEFVDKIRKRFMGKKIQVDPEREQYIQEHMLECRSFEHVRIIDGKAIAVYSDDFSTKDPNSMSFEIKTDIK